MFSQNIQRTIFIEFGYSKNEQGVSLIWTCGIEGPVVKIVTVHNHATQAACPLSLVNQVHNSTSTTFENPQQIFSEVVSGIHADVALLLPSKASLKSIQYARYINNLPPNIENLEDYVTPQALLPNRTRAVYVEMLQQQNRVQPNLQHLMTDFEHSVVCYHYLSSYTLHVSIDPAIS
ncbi:hypothetical protein CHUAL_010713 [Chamberlinius hualienensis]